jgi:hypothetical protein
MMRRFTMMITALSLAYGCAIGSSLALAATAVPRAVGCDGVVPRRQPKHVFVIVLENRSYERTFGKAAPPSYFKDLAHQGVLLSHYYGIGHNSLDNYIAMISGQAPNKFTQWDCPKFIDFVEIGDMDELKSQAKLKLLERLRISSDRDDESRGATESQQPAGAGCVYPARIMTVTDQLEGRSDPLTWAAYMEGMPENCAHPPIGQFDDTRNRRSYEGKYAVRHNPFVYFHSILDSKSCDQHDKPLGAIDGSTAGLVRDLQSPQSPALIFISPDLCNDGHNDCDGTGEAGKLARVHAFLRQWVPAIQTSAAYKEDGMIVITFDEAEVELAVDKNTLRKNREASKACCNEQPGPSADDPGLFGPGGGRVGAVVLSPLVKPGTKNKNDFNHYALLRSIEDMFGLEHLGFARPNTLKTFQECGVFKPDPPISPAAKR